MEAKRGSERRRSPRVPARHDLVVRPIDADGTELRAQSVNLNLGGLYCTLDHWLQPFTKIAISLSLPISLDVDESKSVDIAVDGVVVRIEPAKREVGRTSYECAVAFVGLDEDAELAIARYLLAELVRST